MLLRQCANERTQLIIVNLLSVALRQHLDEHFLFRNLLAIVEVRWRVAQEDRRQAKLNALIVRPELPITES